MKHLIYMAAVAGALTAASAVQAQVTMPLVWMHNDNQLGAPAWLNAGDTTRGMGYNATSGHLLVADRDGSGNTVRRLVASTGVENGTVNQTPAYSLGTFVVNKAVAASDGTVYMSNLAAATSTYKIYRHADENTGPTDAFVEAAMPVRLGDDFAITGTGNGTRFLSSGSGNAQYGVFTTVDAGLTFTRSATGITSPTIAGIPNLTWDDADSNKFWARRSAASLAGPNEWQLYRYASTAATSPEFIITPIDQADGPIDVNTLTEGQVVAVGPAGRGAGSTNVKANLYDAVTGANLAQTAGGLEQVPAGSVANGNGSGDVVIDVPNRRLYVLWTNNALAAFDIPSLAQVSDWNLY